MAENLLQWLPCLSEEDRRAIGYAMIHHANSLTKCATHYQAADARRIGFLKRQDVIDALLKPTVRPWFAFSHLGSQPSPQPVNFKNRVFLSRMSPVHNWLRERLTSYRG